MKIETLLTAFIFYFFISRMHAYRRMRNSTFELRNFGTKIPRIWFGDSRFGEKCAARSDATEKKKLFIKFNIRENS